MLKKENRTLLFGLATIVALAVILTSCAGTASEPGEIVRQYYSAIENGDADAAAALFSETAEIVTPNGNMVSGDEIESQFISFDIQSMDSVVFLSEFSESNGKITWTQRYFFTGGNSFLCECEITIKDGKIDEWLFE